ncbi:helix-turn-helix transcriptional regulator [Jannaschia pohangensis]|nr:AraC family transcriptional regulator [Jannaschia pohangensis]
MDRPMVRHAHREGHLVFHVQGPPAEMVVESKAYPIAPGQAAAVSPWQPHLYRPLHDEPTLALVLYINPGWFLEASRRATSSLRFGRNAIEASTPINAHVHHIARVMLEHEVDDGNVEDEICALTQTCFDQSWQWTTEGTAFVGRALPVWDFRVRASLRLMRDHVGSDDTLTDIARAAGLSRPHFYKLFRQHVGVTPNLYMNALRMERAIGLLTDSQDAVTDIGFDLGFSSQASFSRFFIANGVVAPSDYRRSVLNAMTL